LKIKGYKLLIGYVLARYAQCDGQVITGGKMVRAARAFEAFLLRIKPSEQQVVLKGGFAVYVRFGGITRPTEDLDLAIRKENSTDKSDQMRTMKQILEIVASIDLKDFFTFLIGESTQDLGAEREFDGWRFPVVAKIGGREFKRFHIDLTVGDSILSPVDDLPVRETLAFAGFLMGKVEAIRLAQHYSEKLHAYVRTRKRENSRVKDLFDMVFFIRRGLKPELVSEVVEEVFFNCGGPLLPLKLDSPARSWKMPFEEMAAHNSMDLTLDEAFKVVSDFHKSVIMLLGHAT
jgi:predicted nucleotidyltransferase component of viral defense system